MCSRDIWNLTVGINFFSSEVSDSSNSTSICFLRKLIRSKQTSAPCLCICVHHMSKNLSNDQQFNCINPDNEFSMRIHHRFLLINRSNYAQKYTLSKTGNEKKSIGGRKDADLFIYNYKNISFSGWESRSSASTTDRVIRGQKQT